jgi:hypothetical protein
MIECAKDSGHYRKLPPASGEKTPVGPPKMFHIVGDGEMGGGTTVVLTLAATFTELGWDVTIVSQLGSPLIQAARIRKLKTLETDFSRRGSISAFFSILKHMWRFRPEYNI